MGIVNLTPHAVVVIDGPIFQPSGTVARVSTSCVEVGSIDGVVLVSTQFGEVEGLPEPQKGIRFIVSRVVLAACPNRRDLMVPNELVRDDQGRPIGCRNFAVS
jgi:hypothetical protein